MSATGTLARPSAPDRRAERSMWIVVGTGAVLVLAMAVLNLPAVPALGVLVAGLVIVSYQQVLLAWQTMLGLILLVILFIPIRRYTVGANLPIELEPYRIVIALVIACWLCALAADPDVRLRKTGLEVPMATALAAIVLSLALNIPRVTGNTAFVIKQISFFVSYLVFIYFIMSVIRTRRDLDRMLMLLVLGGAAVALATLVEWKTGTNQFNWYSRVIPFLTYADEGAAVERGVGVRARGSAQHPIALGAALVMLLPLAIYLYKRDKRAIWLGCGGLLTLGALATGSRTGAVMLGSLLVTFLVLKRRETVRLLPMLLPLIVVTQVVMPGTLGTFKSLLSPSYVLAEQSYDRGSGAGRVADLGPALDRWSTKPLLGEGFATRVTSTTAAAGSDQQILDNQWLGALIETGAIGVFGLLWVFGRSIRRLGHIAKQRADSIGWLATAVAASITAYIVGLLTYDGFAFIQVTFIAFTMVAIAAVVTQTPADEL